MKTEGVEILCVGVGKGKLSEKLKDQLRQLASEPRFLFETTFDLLRTIEDQLTKETCEAASKLF